MIATAALITDTFREAFARKIFWGLFGLSTLMILFFLFIMKIDVVEGAVATVTLFGKSAQRGTDINRLVAQTFAAISSFLYTFGMALAVFASAGLVPSVLEPGRIELLLSKPVSRPHILLGRYAGNVLVVGLNITYLIVGIWLILGAKTGIWHGRFLAAILTTTAIFAVLLAVVVLIGVIWESAALATMVTVALMIVSPILAQKTTAERLLSSETAREIWRVLYYTLPKVFDLGAITRQIALDRPVESWMPLWSSALFGAVVLAIGMWIFMKRDF
ncbi:MAG: ABC transporter permease subunit [Acidobacteria bacterium]|nr:ABC transporter permease subunit [Acidobacteriota bacterium]